MGGFIATGRPTGPARGYRGTLRVPPADGGLPSAESKYILDI